MVILFSGKKAGIDEDHQDDSSQGQVNDMIGSVQGIDKKLKIEI